MVKFANNSWQTPPPGCGPVGRLASAGNGEVKVGRRRLSGFSIPELLVAMVIGLIAVVVMLQMLSQFEGQKRTTTSGDDAISSGSVSLYAIQRDLQQAGWGMSAVQLLGCTVSGLANGGASISLAPVTINSTAITGADPGTDTLLIVSGNGNSSGGEGDLIRSATATVYSVYGPATYTVNDFVVATPRTRVAGACTRNAVSISAVASSAVTVSAAASGFTVAANDLLFQLGANPMVRVYAVRNGNLTVCNWRVNNCGLAANNNDASVWVPIAANVVSLRAQYGRDTTSGTLGAMDGIVDVWDKNVPTTATPISTSNAKNIEACALARIPAVRLALVARSSQPERLTSTGAHVWPNEVTWMGSAPAAVAIDSVAAAAAAISLTSAIASPDAVWPTWQDFRYKVFQTVVPLRNVSSRGVYEEC